MKKYNKRPKHMMDPILDDELYALMSQYDLEQSEGAKSIFNGFIQNNKDILFSIKVGVLQSSGFKNTYLFCIFL